MSVGDTLELEPTHICERDRKELIRKFEEELEQRGPRIRAGVRKEYMPVDVELLPKNQRNTIKEWCDQALVLGFNCGRYDLNLNKEHFAERLADAGTKIRVAKQGKNIMFSLTPRFRFLDIINYVGPEPATTSGQRHTDVTMRNRGSRMNGLTTPKNAITQIYQITQLGIHA